MSLHCEAYVSYLIRNGRFNSKSDYQLGNKTICEIASSIKRVFRCLKRDAGLLENPWDDVILPAMDDSLRREIFTVDELQKIRCGILHNSFCRPLFTIAAATGLREGDICTLRWNEIDWVGKNIRRVLNKTRKEVSIPIHRMLYDYFLRLHNEDEYVFPSTRESIYPRRLLFQSGSKLFWKMIWELSRRFSRKTAEVFRLRTCIPCGTCFAIMRGKSGFRFPLFNQSSATWMVV